LPGSSPVSSAFPTLMSGRLPASFRERDFSRGKFSRLQLFRYVQASELACLPDRSYRCRFPRRAAEAFTSEQNVRRYLRTHRICSPPDYRQLAARGLSPREIHSIVDCSTSDIPENNEVLDGAGFTFHRGDQADLERMLDLLVHNPELRRQSAARERERIQHQHLWPEIARSIEKAYYNVLGWTPNEHAPSEQFQVQASAVR